MYEQLIQNIQDRNLPLSGETINDLIKGHHPSSHLIKGNLDIEDLEVFRDFLQEDPDTLLKGKRAQLGEERTWSGEVFIRTETGWKYKGKAPKEGAPKEEGAGGSKEKEETSGTKAMRELAAKLEGMGLKDVQYTGFGIQSFSRPLNQSDRYYEELDKFLDLHNIHVKNPKYHQVEGGNDEGDGGGSQLDRHTKKNADPKQDIKDKLQSALGGEKSYDGKSLLPVGARLKDPETGETYTVLDGGGGDRLENGSFIRIANEKVSRSAETKMREKLSNWELLDGKNEKALKEESEQNKAKKAREVKDAVNILNTLKKQLKDYINKKEIESGEIELSKRFIGRQEDKIKQLVKESDFKTSQEALDWYKNWQQK